jgi:amidase
MTMKALTMMMGAALICAAVSPAQAQPRVPKVEEVSLSELSTMLEARRTTSEALVRAYLARIDAMDRKGPKLHSVIMTNPDAIAQARALDAERRAGRVRGPLHGVPILIKDNIETADRMPTTAGSLALAGNMTGRDAPVVARLRAAGAVILGKTNLSEWANIRSPRSMSGWSAVGGLVRNPYALDRTACGSSSGSGSAIAASFAAAALGTETDGSVVCPSSINGLVGLKPTLGTVSRTHVVPISHSQDTPGPMARSVTDAAVLFSAMVGEDAADPATKGANEWKRDYAAGLSLEALRGKRVAVLKPRMSPDLAAQFDRALGVLAAIGATVVEVKSPKLDGVGEAEFTVLKTELKADLDSYLASRPAALKGPRSLADVIAFNRSAHLNEMPFFGQETFEDAAKTKGLSDPEYIAAREKSLAGATTALRQMLTEARADILIQPSYGAAWLSDPVHGDQFSGPSASELPAVSGWPHLTVPMGFEDGLPVGLSFIGEPHSEARLFQAGYAFEQAMRARRAPTYQPSVATGQLLEAGADIIVHIDERRPIDVSPLAQPAR